MNWIREVLSRMLRCEIATHEDVTLIWRVVRNIPTRFTQLERLIMATKEELIGRLDAASNEIASDLTDLRTRLQDAVADKDQAVQDAVNAALDGFDAPIARLEALGTDPVNPVPDPEPTPDPEPAPPVEGDGGVDVDADGNPV